MLFMHTNVILVVMLVDDLESLSPFPIQSGNIHMLMYILYVSATTLLELQWNEEQWNYVSV